jgi:hypothetical protein
MTSNLSFMRGVSKRRRLLLVFASSCAVAASLVALFFYALLYKERETRFPMLSAGIYSGFISGLNTNEYLPLIVERSEGQNSLTFVVDAPGYNPVTALLVKNGDNHALPIIFSTSVGDFVISGSTEGDNASGNVKTQTGLSLGDWTLSKLKPQVLNAEQQESLIPRINQLILYQDILERTTILAQDNPAKETQLNKLTEFLQETSTVKSRAKNKLIQARADEEQLKSRFNKKLKLVQKAYKALKAAERVTADGRLVVSSRLSLEREAQWVRLTTQPLTALPAKKARGR